MAYSKEDLVRIYGEGCADCIEKKYGSGTGIKMEGQKPVDWALPCTCEEREAKKAGTDCGKVA